MDGAAGRALSTSTCTLAGSANGGAVRDDQSARQRNLGGDRRLDRGDRVTDGPSREGRRAGGSARQSAGIAAADRSARGGAKTDRRSVSARQRRRRRRDRVRGPEGGAGHT